MQSELQDCDVSTNRQKDWKNNRDIVACWFFWKYYAADTAMIYEICYVGSLIKPVGKVKLSSWFISICEPALNDNIDIIKRQTITPDFPYDLLCLNIKQNTVVIRRQWSFNKSQTWSKCNLYWNSQVVLRNLSFFRELRPDLKAIFWNELVYKWSKLIWNVSWKIKLERKTLIQSKEIEHLQSQCNWS